MERVYLLLRNNNQTGPFTIGELLQQQLKPSDMIWIEGKSAAWTYLSELELIPFIKAQEAKPVQRSRSADEIESMAEELRQRILATAPKSHFPSRPVEVESFDSPYRLPENEIQFVDHRKERKMRNHTVIGEMLLTCVVIGLFMVGIYKGKSFLGIKKAIPNSVATQLNSHDEHAAQKTRPTVSLPVIIPDTTKKLDSAVAVQISKPKPTHSKRAFVDSVTKSAAIQVPPVNQTENKEETSTETTVKVPAEVPLKEATNTTLEKSKNQEEKKGFLRGLFKKKKKDDNSGKDDNKDE